MRRRYTFIFAGLLGVLLLVAAYFIVPNIFGSIVVPLPEEYKPYLLAAAKKYNVDSCLGAATINIESNWNIKARSGAGAKGLGQIIDGTFGSIGRQNGIDTSKGPYDPETNINVMMAYHAYNIKLYGQSLRNVGVAYNGGGGRVATPDSRLPLETRFYITKLSRNYFLYSSVYPDFCTGPTIPGGPAVGSGSDDPVYRDFALPETPKPGYVDLNNFWKSFIK